MEQEIDTRSAIENAFNAVEEGQEPPVEQEIVEPEKPIEDAVVVNEPESPDVEAEEAKPEPNVEAEPETPEPTERDQAPSSWTKEAKAEFSKLPESVKREIARREADFHKGIEEFKEYADRARQYDDAIAPYIGNFRAGGVEPVAGIRHVLEVENTLRNADPITKARMIMKLAQDYGADMKSLANLTPEQARLSEEHERLRRERMQVQQQQQTIQQREQQAALDEIQKFAADPKNEYFEQVKAEMSVLLQSGQAGTMQEAYDRAIWMRPDIRQTLIERQRAEAQQKASKQAQANRAKTASASIKGSSPVNTGTKPATDDLRQLVADQFN